jgi:hypothetical protein
VRFSVPVSPSDNVSVPLPVDPVTVRPVKLRVPVIGTTVLSKTKLLVGEKFGDPLPKPLSVEFVSGNESCDASKTTHPVVVDDGVPPVTL